MSIGRVVFRFDHIIARSSRRQSIIGTCMHFSNKKRDRARSHHQRFQRAQDQPEIEAEPSEVIPDFNQLLRNFYKRSHPDLLRHSHPQFAEVNDDSLQVLNGVLSTIKVLDQYPPMLKKDVTFYLRSTSDRQVVDQYVLKIRTAGGDCRKQLTTTFQMFFIDTKISETGKFNWNKEYFPISSA
jgi:hypothetical protein